MGARTRSVLLFIDVDMTLCDSSPVDRLLPSDPKDGRDPAAFVPWLEAISRTNFDPMPGAYRMVRALLEEFNPITVILTNRAESIRAPTRIWIDHHFPMLRDAELSMRSILDLGMARDSKMARIHPYRDLHPMRAVYVLDDDPDMMAACEKPSDRFILAGDEREA